METTPSIDAKRTVRSTPNFITKGSALEIQYVVADVVQGSRDFKAEPLAMFRSSEITALTDNRVAFWC